MARNKKDDKKDAKQDAKAKASKPPAPVKGKSAPPKRAPIKAPMGADEEE